MWEKQAVGLSCWLFFFSLSSLSVSPSCVCGWFALCGPSSLLLAAVQIVRRLFLSLFLSAGSQFSLYFLELFPELTIKHNTVIHTMKFVSSLLTLALAASAAAFSPASTPVRAAVSTQMAASDEFYIDEERRFVMNLIMVGAGGLSVAAIGIPYIAFFVPPGAGGGAGGVPAKDALGTDLFAKEYLASKPAGDRSLAQGLKGDAT